MCYGSYCAIMEKGEMIDTSVVFSEERRHL